MSMPLHPQMLAGMGASMPAGAPEGGSRMPGMPPPPLSAFPPGVARGAMPPGQLAGFQPGAQMQPAGGNPFMGNQNLGQFGTPAPFNPLLAQILMGQRGGGMPSGGGMGAPGAMPRGPMGSFGLTPERQRPKSAGAGNPYR
jgi:hypothetical protein